MARLYCARTDTHNQTSIYEPLVYTIYQGDALCRECFDIAVEHSRTMAELPPAATIFLGSPAAFRQDDDEEKSP